MCHFLISLNFYIAYNDFFLSNTLSSFVNFTRICSKQKRIENERKKKLLPIFFSSFKSLNHINLLDFDKTTLVHKSDESFENSFPTIQ